MRFLKMSSHALPHQTNTKEVQMSRAPTNLAPEHLLTIKDASEFCRVSGKTIRRWIGTGDLTAAKLGAQWRIRPKDLALFIADRVR